MQGLNAVAACISLKPCCSGAGGTAARDRARCRWPGTRCWGCKPCCARSAAATWRWASWRRWSSRERAAPWGSGNGGVIKLALHSAAWPATSGKRQRHARLVFRMPRPAHSLTQQRASALSRTSSQPWQSGPHHKQPAHLSASRFMRDAITSIWPSWLKARLSIVVVRLSTDLSGLPASAVQNAAVGQAARHPRADR